jgi:hypothetical protein
MYKVMYSQCTYSIPVYTKKVTYVSFCSGLRWAVVHNANLHSHKMGCKPCSKNLLLVCTHKFDFNLLFLCFRFKVMEDINYSSDEETIYQADARPTYHTCPEDLIGHVRYEIYNNLMTNNI